MPFPRAENVFWLNLLDPDSLGRNIRLSMFSGRIKVCILAAGSAPLLHLCYSEKSRIQGLAQKKPGLRCIHVWTLKIMHLDFMNPGLVMLIESFVIHFQSPSYYISHSLLSAKDLGRHDIYEMWYVLMSLIIISSSLHR